MKPPAEPKLTEPKWMTHEEFAGLIEAAPDDRKFRYTFLVYTGMRKGEALRVRWDDIDFERVVS